MKLNSIRRSSVTPIAKIIYCLLFFTNTSCDDIEIIRSDTVQAQNIKNKDIYIAPLTLEEERNNQVLINDELIVFEQGVYVLHEAGFYTISVNNSGQNQFVLFDGDRMSGDNDSPEWGLLPWVPTLPEMNNELSSQFDLIHPKSTIETIAIPFVLKIKNWSVDCSASMACLVNDQTDFLLKNGIGSASLKSNVKYAPVKIGNNELKINLSQNTNSEIILSGDISDHRQFEANSVVHITNDINILNTGSLKINEGAIIIVDEGVNVYHGGPIFFKGSEQNPILVTCSNSEKYFGGFISTGDGAIVEASHTFFSQFSFNEGGEFDYGHAHHQALFKSENSQQQFENCYFMDSPGQVFYTTNSSLLLNDIVVQRVKTTGQLNGGNVSIDNSYFSDFPNDSKEYFDKDNDGIYLSGIDAEIENSMIMYAKDDGIDTGGSDGGNVAITNCVIKACFHEGIAMSSVWPAKKKHTITACKISDCQQGIELGYSSSGHTVIVDNCDIFNNYIGVRFGDCYNRKVHGKLTLRNSSLSNNEKNTWNMVRQNWKANTSNFIIENTVFE